MGSLFSILNLVTFFPLVGVLVILLLPKDRHNAIRWTAMAAAIATFGISMVMLGQFDSSNPDLQMVIQLPWFSFAGWDIEYRDLGRGAAHVRRHQVLPLHDGGLDPDAAGDPVAGDQRRDIQRSGADRRRRDPGRDPDLALPGLCRRVCDQGSDVAAALMAPRRTRRGAHRLSWRACC